MEREENQKEHQSCLKRRCLRHPWAGKTAGDGSRTAAPSSRDSTEEEESYTLERYLSATEKPASRENRQEQRCCLQAQPQVEPRVRERSWGEQNPRAGFEPGRDAALQSDRSVAETAGDWRLRSRFPSKVWTLLVQAELMGSGGPQHFQHRGELRSKRTPGFSSYEYREENEIRPSYINPTVTDK